MSRSEPKPVTVSIFDKEYTLGCTEDERASLFAAVELLNQRMGDLRDGGKVIGAERIAVISALNLAHEFLNYQKTHSQSSSALDEQLSRINDKVARALARGTKATAKPAPPAHEPSFVPAPSVVKLDSADFDEDADDELPEEDFDDEDFPPDEDEPWPEA